MFRDSKFKGSSGCSQFIKIAKEVKSFDDLGHTSEFIRLVKTYNNNM